MIDIIANMIVEFLFSGLFRILYEKNYPAYVKYPLAFIIVSLYLSILGVLMYYTYKMFAAGQYFMMVFIGFLTLLYAILIVEGFLYQKQNREE